MTIAVIALSAAFSYVAVGCVFGAILVWCDRVEEHDDARIVTSVVLWPLIFVSEVSIALVRWLASLKERDN